MQETLSATPAVKPKYPKSIPFIIGNEAAERFSFYGMRSILVTFLVAQFYGKMYDPTIAAAKANQSTHFFVALAYTLPFVGGLVADWFTGKYKIILYISIVYCVGHLFLAVFDTNLNGFIAGLVIIAVGAGGIKSCVSANVGDQFDASNQSLLSKVYGWFYFSINAGSMFSTVLIPYTYKNYGAQWAFGIPGILMGIATIIFFSGRKMYVRVPPTGLLFRSSFFSLNGRIRRTEYAITLIIISVIYFVFNTIPLAPNTHNTILLVLMVPLLWFGLSQGAKRCHDIGKNGWYQFIPFYAIWLLIKNGDESKNDYGVVPPPSGVNNNNFVFISLYSIFNIGKKKKGESLLDVAKGKFNPEKVEGIKAVYRVLAVFAFVPIFWAMWDQSESEWVLQAEKCYREINLGFTHFTILPGQVQTVNPVFLLLFIPIFNYGIYPLFDKIGIKTTPLRRIGAGLFLTGLSFVIIALIQTGIDNGGHPNIWWQVLAFIVLSAGEVMVSITGLEYAYTQSPISMKSTMSAIWLLTVALGNLFVGYINGNISSGGYFARFTGASYFWFFVELLAGILVIYLIVSPRLKERNYIIDPDHHDEIISPNQ